EDPEGVDAVPLEEVEYAAGKQGVRVSGCERSPVLPPREQLARPAKLLGRIDPADDGDVVHAADQDALGIGVRSEDVPGDRQGSICRASTVASHDDALIQVRADPVQS